jgi:hypothetical protein
MKKVELTEQILRLYMGRECTYDSKFDAGIGIVTDGIICWREEGTFEVTPHLRPLSSITEDEANEFWAVSNDRPYHGYASGLFEGPFHKNTVEWFYSFYTKWGPGETSYTAAEFLYLISKGFDLFGLIDAGLAKEVTQ